MRFYRSTLLAVLMAASTLGGVKTVGAQSFDYPQNSQSLFSRWAENQKSTTTISSPIQQTAPTAPEGRFSLKRLIGEKTAITSGLVERIKAFDNNKTFALAPRNRNASQNQQTAWAQPAGREQIERSILEVVEEQPEIDTNLPRYQLDAPTPIPGNARPFAPSQQTWNRGPQTANAPQATSQTNSNPVAPNQTRSNQGIGVGNHRTAAHPLSINDAKQRADQMSTTQAMLQRQQMREGTVPRNMSATAPKRIDQNSFASEFNKAYRYINASGPNNTASTDQPAARVAQQFGQPAVRSNSIRAFNTSHRTTDPATSSSADADFELIRDDDVSNLDLESFPPDDSGEIAPGEFTLPDLNAPAPHEAPSSFAPPEKMTFDIPADVLPAEPDEDETPPTQPDALPDLIPDALPEMASDALPVLPPEAPAHTQNIRPEPPSTNANKQFAPVETAQTWTPPVVSGNPVPMMTPQTNTPVLPTVMDSSDDQVAWWKNLVAKPLHPENNTRPVDTNGLVLEALRSSPRIKAVSKTPLIRELQVVEADADFDPVTFLQSQFQDRVDPVGNTLTTGGEPFLKDNILTSEAGIRRRLRNGADYRLSQRIGFQNSNSNFFTPQDQGTATLALNVTQPLLRGRGQYVNQAQILIAQSAGGAAWDTFKADLQEELEGMVTSYWDLYLQRSIYLQKKRNVQRGQVMLDRLKGRQGLDSLPAQIARAQSAVLTRRTELANAFRDVRNAETEIRRRIADKNWQASQSIELLPAEIPFAQATDLELEQVVYAALENRPEISEVIRRIRVAGVQRDVSVNELLPQLSLLMGAYVSSLRGDTGILNAFQDQFGQVKPGYSVGLEFELPYRNRAARSRLQQRNLQFKRLQNELESVIQNVIAESQVATRQVSSAYETLNAAKAAVVAARADLTQNEKRWESFALIEGDLADGQSPTTVLDQLLDSQERLSQAENVYAQAEQELKVAEVSLQRIMGTLLIHQQVDFSRTVKCDTPSIHINKRDSQSQRVFDDYPAQQPLVPTQAIHHAAPHMGTSAVENAPSFRQTKTGHVDFSQITPGQMATEPNRHNRVSHADWSRQAWPAPTTPQPQVQPTGYPSQHTTQQADFGYPAK